MSYKKNSLLFSDGVASVFSTTSDYLNSRRTYRQNLRYFPLNVVGKSGKTSRTDRTAFFSSLDIRFAFISRGRKK